MLWRHSIRSIGLLAMDLGSECFGKLTIPGNGTACFENVNICLNTIIYSYLETSGGQSYGLYLNFVHFFNTSVNLWQL
jgi:hypothetical protein